MTEKHDPALADDLLEGVPEISAFTGLGPRRVYYLVAKQELRSPFHIGRKIYARKSTLLREIAEREDAVRARQ